MRLALDPNEDRWFLILSHDGSSIAFTKTPASPIQIFSRQGHRIRQIRVKGWSNLLVTNGGGSKGARSHKRGPVLDPQLVSDARADFKRHWSRRENAKYPQIGVMTPELSKKFWAGS